MTIMHYNCKKTLLTINLIAFFGYSCVSLSKGIIPPSVKIIYPTQGAIFNRSQVLFKVNASDNKGVRKVKTNISHPKWAKQAYEALQNYKYIVDFWVKSVAADTSQSFFNIAGGWNDDVELSQSLMGYWLLTGDDSLADMFRSMADRIQQAPYLGQKKSPWVQLDDKRIEQGYGTVMLDADHSSEETTLVFPRLFLIDFGEPTTIELMTRLIWNFQDNVDNINIGEKNWGQWVKTGILMRSPRFNARNLDWCWHTTSGHICFEPQDTINNFRTTAPGLSIAWYFGANHYFWQNNVHGFIRGHHAAWINASLQENGTKPAFIPPSKILIPSLEFGDWTINNADPTGAIHGWVSGAWVFRHFYNAMIADTILFTNHPDKKMREMASNANQIVRYAYLQRQRRNLVPVVNEPLSLDRQFLQWRAETGATPGDDQFLSQRTAKSPNTHVMAYLINMERHKLAKALPHAIEAFRQLSHYLLNRREKWTTDLSQSVTGLTDQVKFGLSDSFLMASLGGSGIYDGAFPTIYYSFEDTKAKVVSLIKTRHPRDTSFWLYNFGKQREIGLKLWRFIEGSGQLTLGPDVNQDGTMDKITQVIKIDQIRKGTEIRFNIPGSTQFLARIEVTKPLPTVNARLPDLAIGRKDFFYSDKSVTVRVHNLGNETENVKIRIYNKSGQQMADDIAINFASFNTMNPVTQLVTWDDVNSNEIGWIVVDPDNKILELSKLNNTLIIKRGQFYYGAKGAFLNCC